MREGLQKVVPSDDTIVAISTPSGRSGIGVVRLSGAEARTIACRFLKLPEPLAHRQAQLGSWRETNGNVVDEVVATLFEAPHSYTGEDVVELSAHGNPLILQRIVNMACSAAARLAGPGEFTLRAVLNGKMDLIQAEAVRSFIDAQTDAQAQSAQLQLSGELSRAVRPSKEILLDVIAHLEAGIDFADDDVAPPESAVSAEKLQRVIAEFKLLQQSYSFGRLLSQGLKLAVVGKPNVGKSSLFNRLVGAERAIVSSVPGTTRDVLRECINVEGVPLQFLDTAGWRDTEDPVERIGVERAGETLEEADFVLVVLDGSSELEEWDRRLIDRVRHREHRIVVNKSDLPRRLRGEDIAVSGIVWVSAKTGGGIADLERTLREFLSNRSEGVSGALVTSARQHDAIHEAVQAMEKGNAALLSGTPHEMVLLDLYNALGALNELTGEVVTEDILGRIFSTFCVGK